MFAGTITPETQVPFVIVMKMKPVGSCDGSCEMEFGSEFDLLHCFGPHSLLNHFQSIFIACFIVSSRSRVSCSSLIFFILDLYFGSYKNIHVFHISFMLCFILDICLFM